MVDSNSRVSPPRIILMTSGAVTAAFLTTSTALCAIDSSKTDVRVSTFHPTATAATVLDAFAVCSILVLTITRSLKLKPSWIFRWVLPWGSALIGLSAAILTLNVLILKRINPKDVASSSGRARPAVNSATEFTIWVFASLSQLVFYAIFTFLAVPATSDSPQRPQRTSFFREKKRKAPERPPRPPTPPTPLRVIAPPYALPQARAGSPFNAPSSPPETKRQSWRNSLSSMKQVVRAQNSRTKLLSNGGERMSRDSQSIASDTRSFAGSDSFNGWDVHSPPEQVRDTLSSPTMRGKGTALEPIPDSRPASPARALDGPFPPQSSSSPITQDRPSTSLSNRVIERPPTAYSTASSRRGTPRPSSRAASPSLHEAHIHPLFRTDSPTPPPGTSPNTIVTAAPFSGHVIGQVGVGPSPTSPRPSLQHSRMRSNEFLGGRAASVPRSEPRQANGDALRPSLEAAPSAPSAPYARGQASANASGASTPQCNSLTNSIPEFVLSASKERII